MQRDQRHARARAVLHSVDVGHQRHVLQKRRQRRVRRDRLVVGRDGAQFLHVLPSILGVVELLEQEILVLVLLHYLLVLLQS